MADWNAAVYVGTAYSTLSAAVAVAAAQLRSVNTGSAVHVFGVIPISGGRMYQPYIVYG